MGFESTEESVTLSDAPRLLAYGIRMTKVLMSCCLNGSGHVNYEHLWGDLDND